MGSSKSVDDSNVSGDLRFCSARTGLGGYNRWVCPKIDLSEERYAVVDCKDPRERQVVAILVPILYLRKSNKVTVTVGNTIFGALTGQR